MLTELDVVTVFKIRYRSTKEKRPLKCISNLADSFRQRLGGVALKIPSHMSHFTKY